MIMKKSGLLLLVACFLVGLAAGSALAGSRMGDTSPEAQILNPGESADCSNDFVVENEGDQATEVQLLLGKEEVLKDRIQPNDSKGYSLRQQLTLAQQQGKKVEADDPATIINLGKEGKIKFYCKD